MTKFNLYMSGGLILFVVGASLGFIAGTQNGSNVVACSRLSSVVSVIVAAGIAAVGIDLLVRTISLLLGQLIARLIPRADSIEGRQGSINVIVERNNEVVGVVNSFDVMPDRKRAGYLKARLARLMKHAEAG